MSYRIAAFYKFAPLEPARHRQALAGVARAGDVRGTILLAPEGINGTIAGPRAGLEAVLNHVRTLPGCAGLDWKEATASRQPFRRLKVRLKKEIVTLGQSCNPGERVGTFVAPEDWNAVIEDADTVVIDTRNDYEVGIGTFRGALDPGTASFGEFPRWWEENRERLGDRRIAMFCTGGIRCEKASSWLLDQGVPEVLHLKGGILNYLQQVPEAASTWEGECYVFDDRVAVRHGLVVGEHTMCHACGRPVSAEGRRHPDYSEGISCPACIGQFTDADRTRFAERQRQIDAGEF